MFEVLLIILTLSSGSSSSNGVQVSQTVTPMTNVQCQVAKKKLELVQGKIEQRCSGAPGCRVTLMVDCIPLSEGK